MTRAKWLGWVAVLGVLGVLGFLSVASAEPNPSGASAGRIDRVACARAPGVPDHVDLWVVLGSGRIFYDKPLFHKNLPSDAVVYVYKPNDSTCRKKESTAAVTQAVRHQTGSNCRPFAVRRRKGRDRRAHRVGGEPKERVGAQADPRHVTRSRNGQEWGG